MTFDKKLLQSLSLMLLILFSINMLAEETHADAGITVSSHGLVTAQAPAKQVRILGDKSPVFAEDVISSGPNSYAVIEFNDGTHIALRPNTVFSLEEYSHNKEKESAEIHLYKGGLRAITGEISKHNPEGLKVTTEKATVTAHGGEFDVRICEQDCAREKPKHKKAVQPPLPVAARVAHLQGELYATGKDFVKRRLQAGGAIFEGDVLETGAGGFTIIAFRDEGRVTMKELSVFRVAEYRYAPDKPAEGNALLELVKGGLRAVTGIIGKQNKEAYHFTTYTATIGIRGTGFDLLWLGACEAVSRCGLVVFVWDGAIYVKNEFGLWEMTAGQVLLVRETDQPAEPETEPPTMDVPRPDEFKIDFNNLFGTETLDQISPGFYVATYSGDVTLTQGGTSIDLGSGEAGYAATDGSTLLRLEKVQSFQVSDPYLITVDTILNNLSMLLNDTVTLQDQFQCYVQ